MCVTLSQLQDLNYGNLAVIELIIDLATLQAIDFGKPSEAMEMALQVKKKYPLRKHRNKLKVPIFI